MGVAAKVCMPGEITSLPSHHHPIFVDLKRRVRGTTVQQHILSDHEPCVLRAHESTGGTELFLGAITARRKCCILLRTRLVKGDTACIRCSLVQRDHAIRVMQPRQQVVDDHTLPRHLARDTCDEARQTRARGVGQAKNRNWCFHRDAGDVDNTAPAAICHARDQRLHQRNWGQHVGLKRVNECVPLPIRPSAGGRTARIGDQNINFACRLQNLCATVFRGDVGGNGHHFDPGFRADDLGGLKQRPLSPRIHHQRHAFTCQCLRTAKAQAFGRRANQRFFSRNSQIHVTLRCTVWFSNT